METDIPAGCTATRFSKQPLSYMAEQQEVVESQLEILLARC